MTKSKGRPEPSEEFINLHTEMNRTFGVAVVWEEGGTEFVITCGSRSNAESYLTKTMERQPYSAEVVERDVLRVLGPWESVDGEAVG